MKRIGLIIMSAFICSTSLSSSIWEIHGSVTVSGTDTIEADYVVVGSDMAFDYGNRLHIEGGGHVSCFENMYVFGTVSTGVDYDWLYSFASIRGAGSSLNVAGDLSIRSYDLPKRHELRTEENIWPTWGVPCHLAIYDGAEVSIGGNLYVSARSELRLGSEGLLSVGSGLNIASNGLLKIVADEYLPGNETHRLNVNGISSLDGTLNITVPASDTVTYGECFDVFNWNGEVSGEFDSINISSLSDGLHWDTSELYTTGTVTAIPEPSSAILIIVSGGVIYFRTKFRR